MMNKQLLFSLVFLLSVFISSVSQVLLKKSANKAYETKLKEYLNPKVMVAYSLFFSATLITVFAYKSVPLSIGPILESTGYIFVSIMGYCFLKERLSRKKLLGMTVIILGIVVFSIKG